jgi:hypothetical protein
MLQFHAIPLQFKSESAIDFQHCRRGDIDSQLTACNVISFARSFFFQNRQVVRGRQRKIYIRAPGVTTIQADVLVL